MGRLLVALPLLGSVLLYALAPELMTWASYSGPVWLRWLDVGQGILTPPFTIWVLRNIGINISETVLTNADHELVTHGRCR